MQNHFLSCDWGTSNFRLRLVALDNLHVVDEVSSDKGVAELAKSWQAKAEKSEEARIRFYTDVLKDHIAQLETRAGAMLGDVPVIISGMASSSIGLTNLPYQQLPIPTDGSGLKSQSFAPTDDFPYSILLISGVRSNDDVMRGEETQLIGCMTPEMEAYEGAQLVIHPGTHSKHITIRAHRVTDFRTYMSGEFFKLLTTHGILRENVTANPMSDSALPHFEQGVRDSIGQSLLHAAFKVRTNDLFGCLSREDNYHYLSGLLIGNELQELRKIADVKMHLCSGPGLFQQYHAALRILGLDEKVAIFPPEWEEHAVVRGQAKILRRLNEGQID